MQLSSQKLVRLALLVALTVVLTRVASVRFAIGGVEGIRIGFGNFPIILSGILFGPLAGGIVGALGDILGYILNPVGPYMPHFTLVTAMYGFLPALILRGISKEKIGSWQLLLAIALGQGIPAVVFVPFLLETLFHMPIYLTLPPRIISQAILIPTYTLMMIAMDKKLKHEISFRKWHHVG